MIILILKAWDKNNFGNQRWILMSSQRTMMFTYLHKCLREASFHLGSFCFNFTYVISFNVALKLLKGQQMMSCVIMQIRKWTQSFSD